MRKLHPDLGRALLVASAILTALVAVARGWGMLR